MSAAIVDDLLAVLQIERLIAERRAARLKQRLLAYIVGGVCLTVGLLALTGAAIALLAELWSLPAALLSVAVVNAILALALIVVLTRQGEDETDSVLKDLRAKSVDIVRRDAKDALTRFDVRAGAASDTVRLIETLLPILLPLVLEAASFAKGKGKTESEPDQAE